MYQGPQTVPDVHLSCSFDLEAFLACCHLQMAHDRLGKFLHFLVDFITYQRVDAFMNWRLTYAACIAPNMRSTLRCVGQFVTVLQSTDLKSPLIKSTAPVGDTTAEAFTGKERPHLFDGYPGDGIGSLLARLLKTSLCIGESLVYACPADLRRFLP